MFLVDIVVLLLLFLALAWYLNLLVHQRRISPRWVAGAIAGFLGLTPVIYAATGVWVVPWWEVLGGVGTLFGVSFLWLLLRAPAYMEAIQRNGERGASPQSRGNRRPNGPHTPK